MKILALDLSTTGAGYAYFNNNKLVESGTIKPDNPFTDKQIAPKMRKKLNMDSRCHDISETILALLKKRAYDEIIIEDTFSGKDPYCFKWLCRLQGIIIGYCLNKIPVLFVLPSQWRKTLKIPLTKEVNSKMVRLKNNDLKNADIAFAKSLGYNPIDDNEADAICIGYSRIITPD